MSDDFEKQTEYIAIYKPETVDVPGLGSVTTVICGCGHRGFMSIWPSKNGISQCTACGNSMRFV